jgi:hypothetical protein
MTTDSRTWFYTTPEPRPYYIEERVNQTLWKNRLQSIYMTATQVSPPIKMEGKWHDTAIQFEWQPGKYFILRTGQEERELIGVMRQVLMMRPALGYIDSAGMHVVEWHTDGGAERWKQIQGNPQYQGARRYRKD